MTIEGARTPTIPRDEFGRRIERLQWLAAREHLDCLLVNANEAESRRGARFVPFGHTAGQMAVPPLEENRDFPLTLDLRRTSR